MMFGEGILDPRLLLKPPFGLGLREARHLKRYTGCSLPGRRLPRKTLLGQSWLNRSQANRSRRSLLRSPALATRIILV
jgi:hypothetical protein